MTATVQRSDGGTSSASRSPLAWVLLVPITLYRWTAPLRSPRCRFHPSCSAYAVHAIEVHGPLRGAWLGARRLLRCHPWNPGGVDHVPPPADARAPRPDDPTHVVAGADRAGAPTPRK